jgi:HEAT repeat protein
MHWAFWVLMVIVSGVRQGPAQEGSERERQAAADEQILRGAGLAVDGPALLEFLRVRSRLGADADELKALTTQLEDPKEEVRTKAVAGLVARGAAAIPALRHAANSLLDPAAVARARLCLQRIEGPEAATLPTAVARLLAVRKPGGAVEALLAYLPYADDALVAEQVGLALTELAYPDGNADPALVSALSDELPSRRATAAEALFRPDHPEQWPAIRKLLKDRSPAVRLRVALSLTKRQDPEAVPVLIELLAELPAADRRRAEESLQELAGDWAPPVGQMKDDGISRKIIRDSWASWWKNTEGPALLAEFRKRTLGPEDRKKAIALLSKLSAREFLVRERASAALVAFGPRVAPLLREALKSKDSERARRAATCLERIARAKSDPLPLAAARLVSLRRPTGAAEVLLDYLPWAEGEDQVDAVQTALGGLALQDGKPEPSLVGALDDKTPLRRQAAAVALASHGGAEGRTAAHKLLTDPDRSVRLRVAVALANVHDKAAIPPLVDLLAELPAGDASPAEEVLRTLAGTRGPEAPSGDDPAVRQKYRDAWAAWWKQHKDSADLTRLTSTGTQLGYVVLAEVGGVGGGRVREITRDGKPRWSIDNIQFPVDVYVLAENRVLIAEYNGRKITERDFKGKILWSKDGLGNLPVNAQRLANGHTFIATSNELLEVDRKGNTVWQQNVGMGLTAAVRTRGGEIVALTNDGMCVRMTSRGKEIKRFNSGRNGGGGWTSGLDVSPDGKILISQPNRNQVEEFDRDGKSLFKANTINLTGASWLPRGHVLTASYNSRQVIELDRTGRTVWQFTSDLPVFRARRR